MKLVPLGDRVVLKPLVAEETTKSGIVLPGQDKEKPQQAEVVAVGPGTSEVKMEVKKGDKVALIGFGTFQVIKKDKRQGINPATKAKITIPAKKVVKFKAGADLALMVNSKKK